MPFEFRIFNPPPPPVVPLLDTITTAATGAYSTRLLRAAYLGSSMRVRRSSDNAEQDIGFSSGELDTVSLLAFCGAGDGFITKWYDQSGNTRDFAQSTAANQPKIVSAGAVVTNINGKPSVKWDGANTILISAAGLSSFVTAAAYTTLSIFNAVSGGGGSFGNKQIIAETAGDWYPAGISSTPTLDGGQLGGGFLNATVSISLNTSYVQTSKYDGTTFSIWANGGTAGTVAVGNFAGGANVVNMGQSYNGGANHYNGYFNEVVIFNVTLSSADINTLGPNMASRAGATWSNVP